MTFINYSTREINAKVVYYGPGLSGKTTNLQHIYDKTADRSRGRLVNLATDTERTLFFDFLPIELGTHRGHTTRLHLYTVPGQAFYGASRRLILKGLDALVFVCDSQEERLEANLWSRGELERELASQGARFDSPIVYQYNKRDLNTALPVSLLNEKLNPDGRPYFEAVAARGIGVFETLRGVAQGVLQALTEPIGTSPPMVPATGTNALVTGSKQQVTTTAVDETWHASVDRGTELERGGHHEEAVALYAKMLADRPRDWTLVRRLGEAYRALGRNEEASEQLAKLAELYESDGFHLKAAAIWRQISVLQPAAPEPRMRIAELYGRRGLKKEATDQLSLLYQEYRRNGQLREAVDALQRLLQIEGSESLVQDILSTPADPVDMPTKPPAVSLEMAHDSEQKGDLFAALTRLEEATNEHPTDLELAGKLNGLRHKVAADNLRRGHLNVFLSHVQEDKGAVRALYQRLRGDGIAVWFDEESLLPGVDWEMEIGKAVRAADVVLFCLSRRAVDKRGYFQKEMALAVEVAREQPEGTIFVVPVRLEDCPIPDRVRRWQALDYFKDGTYDALVRSLERRMSDLIEIRRRPPGRSQ